ncbi:MAG: choice-of-anchor Q domain-containing protein, partial [Terriglobales bacterium]
SDIFDLSCVSPCAGHGAVATFGGGGGGGVSDGGEGGFGGGGGGGLFGMFTLSGGNGGFGGGGGGAYPGNTLISVSPGKGGLFGGNAISINGGGGGALGGAIFNSHGTVIIRNSTFTNNYVTRGQGGGAGQPGGADNGSDAGGAIFSMDNTLEITNSTFSGNQSTGSGAAIVVYSDEGGDGGPGGGGAPVNFILRNSILANNGADECFLTGGSMFVEGAGNLIMNNSSGMTTSIGTFNACPGVVTTSDPLLQPLQLNSPGNTPTMAILNGSPAVDVANSGTSLSTDQRGVARPQVSGFDIGAYEARPPSFSLSTVRTIPVDINGTISATVTLNSLEYFNSAVTLAVSAFPSGVTVSLSPNPVTPPYNGSVSSTLKISLAPWVTPQTSTLTVSGAGGGISHSIPVSIAIQATTSGASNVVSSIQAAGCFNNRVIAPALTAELNLAQRLAGAGRIQLALGTYSAMLIEIAALKSKRLIASSCGVSGASFDPALVLTTDVRALAANLSTGGHH